MGKTVILAGNAGKCVYYFRFTVSEKDSEYLDRKALFSRIADLSLVEWLKIGGFHHENRC